MRRSLSSVIIAGGLALSGAACTSTPPGHQVAVVNDYTITFRNFKGSEVLSFLDAMEKSPYGNVSIGEHQGGSQAWKQNLYSDLNSTDLYRLMSDVLTDHGYGESQVRITTRPDGYVEVARLKLLNQ